MEPLTDIFQRSPEGEWTGSGARLWSFAVSLTVRVQWCQYPSETVCGNLPGSKLVSLRLIVTFSQIATDFAYVRWLRNRKGIEEQTTTWDKTVVDRKADLENWQIFFSLLQGVLLFLGIRDARQRTTDGLHRGVRN